MVFAGYSRLIAIQLFALKAGSTVHKVNNARSYELSNFSSIF